MAALRNKLIAEGIAAASIDKVRAPAGLDLGSITPEEIALSIIAEIMQLRRQGQRNARPPGSKPVSKTLKMLPDFLARRSLSRWHAPVGGTPQPCHGATGRLRPSGGGSWHGDDRRRQHRRLHPHHDDCHCARNLERGSSLAIALGLMLILIIIAVNALAWMARRVSEVQSRQGMI